MRTNQPRTYSAKKRAAREGRPNPAGDKVEMDLRQGLIEKHGEPVFLKRNKDGEPVSITKVCAPFFAGLYAAKHAVLWEPEEQRFYAYDAEGGVWRVQSEESLIESVHVFMLAESRREMIARDIPALNLEERLTLKLESEVVSRLKAAASKPGVFKRPKFFLDGERYVQFSNGAFVIRGGKPAGFVPGFSRDHYALHRCRVPYLEGAECSEFIAGLKNVLAPENADADIDLLLSFLGMCLIGHNVFQKILVVHGKAGSGKSTMALLLDELLGPESGATFDSHAITTDRFAKSAFLGKSWLQSLDVASNFLIKPGANDLKRLTGGDPVDARLMYGGEVRFYGTLSAFITMNDPNPKVRIDGDREAWQRRLVVVPFIQSVQKVKRDYQCEMIRNEGAGIVFQALNHAMNCLQNNAFPMNGEQVRRVDEMLDRSDTLREFIVDHVQACEDGSLTKRELRDRFKDECKARRWTAPSDREIGSKLPEVLKELFGVSESRSVLDHVGSQVQGFRGVDWRDD